MVFEELLHGNCVVVSVVLRGSELGMTSIVTAETPLRSNRDTMANITRCEPCNVATTLTGGRWTERCVQSAEAQHFCDGIVLCLNR